MVKIDGTVIKETRYIALFSCVLSLLMQAVFLIVLRRFDYTVLLGNLLGLLIGVGNFFFMGIGVQKALKKDADEAKKVLRFSQTARFFGIFVLTIVGVLIPIFDVIALMISIFFPRIAIAAKQIKK
ncbi:MAG: hypothetical protein IKZ59_06990 [Clostridia bacterium]|nr:hypothetical protein [Clostridia bacterium]